MLFYDYKFSVDTQRQTRARTLTNTRTKHKFTHEALRDDKKWTYKLILEFSVSFEFAFILRYFSIVISIESHNTFYLFCFFPRFSNEMAKKATVKSSSKISNRFFLSHSGTDKKFKTIWNVFAWNEQ